MLFCCCEKNLVGIYKNAKAAFDKSSSKNFKYFLCEYQELAKQVSLRGITISLHCLIHLLHNQKSCTIKVQVNLRPRHCCCKRGFCDIACDRIVFSSCTLWSSWAMVSFCNLYLISSPPGLWNMHFLWNIHYKSRKGRYFWLFSLFWRELLTGCPEALDFETFREEPLWRTTKNFQEPFSPSAFNVSLQIIPF